MQQAAEEEPSKKMSGRLLPTAVQHLDVVTASQNVQGHKGFQKGDLEDLMEALLIPEEVVSAQRVRVSGREALCMTLRRLAYPNRLCELELFFRRHSSVISSVVSKVLAHID
ncbi:hypothetical protein MRX96_040577 [Rhipicephalus microplus]